jgi:hypothetical protein
MTEMSQQFDFWGGSAPLGSTRTVPVPQGTAVVVPPRRRRQRAPQQLPMFMSPSELKRLPSGDMVDAEQTVHRHLTQQERQDFWARKRDKAVLTDAGPYGNGAENLAGSIRRQGVQRPVDLEHGPYPYRPDLGTDPTLMVNGHHRVAVADDVRPNQLVPVLHHDVNDEGEGLLPAWARKVPRTFGWRDDH